MSQANQNTTEATPVNPALADDSTGLDTNPTNKPKPKRNRTPKNKSENKPTPNTNDSKPTAPTAKRWYQKFATTNNAKLALTLTMSALPVLSLIFSSVGGHLATQTTNILSPTSALSALFFALTACVLAISLPHLAWAIEDITRSDERSSWILAVAFDVSIVAIELLTTAGHGSTTTTTAMFALVALSSVLNAWTFFRKPTEEEKAARKAAKQNAA